MMEQKFLVKTGDLRDTSAVALAEQSPSNMTIGSLLWPDTHSVYHSLECRHIASYKCPAQKRVWPCKIKLLATFPG